MVRGEVIEPITIQESSFQPNRLLTLRTRNSSAYKGLYALLMRDGGRDFRTGEPIEAQTFFDDKVDIHPFAFGIAREETGKLKASYKKEGSRAALVSDPMFAAAFAKAKSRVNGMDIRFVEETDPTKQALLEIYAATALATRYNDFENH